MITNYMEEAVDKFIESRDTNSPKQGKECKNESFGGMTGNPNPCPPGDKSSSSDDYSDKKRTAKKAPAKRSPHGSRANQNDRRRIRKIDPTTPPTVTKEMNLVTRTIRTPAKKRSGLRSN